MTGFGRSNSLSINTGTGSLFGNTGAGQGQQSAGLFGSSAAASQPQTAGGLFSSTSQSHTGGSLFGGAPASQPPQSGGGLFGQQHQQASQPQSGGGLFSNLNKPSATSGFGVSTAQTQPQQQNQAGSIFGGALGGTQNQNHQNQNTSQSGGLFGGLGSSSQPAKPSLFRSSTTTQQQTATPSLFGGATTQQQTSTPSLFSASTTQQQQPSTFSGMASQQQQPAPFGGLSLGGHTVSAPGQSALKAVDIQDVNLIKGTTRFQELGTAYQNQIIQLDEQIQAWIQLSNQTRESLPQHGASVATVAPDVAYVQNFLSTVELGLDNDSTSIAHLKEICKKDAEDALLSFRAVENLKLPSQFHYARMSSTLPTKPNVSIPSDGNSDDPTKPVDLVSYFVERTENLGDTLTNYQQQIREIEAHLRTIEDGTQVMAQELMGSRDRLKDQRRELVEALKAIESAILQAAKKVGETRDMYVQEMVGSAGGLGLGV